MKLLETKSVQVGAYNFPIRITNRSIIEFESMGHKLTDINSTEDIIKFFYCTAKAGAKHEGTSFNLTYEEFLDMIDDYYQDVVINFTAAISQPNDLKKK